MDLWKKHLESATVNVLPTDYVPPSDGRIVEAVYSAPVKADLRHALTTLATRSGVSETQIGLALWSVLVFRLTGDEDVSVCSMIPTGQPTVLRTGFSGETRLADLLANVTKAYELIKQAPISLAELRSLGIEVRTGFSAVSSGMELTADVAVVQGSANIVVQYNTLLYKKRRIEILVEQWSQLAYALAADPEQPVAAVSLVTPSAKPDLPDPSADLDWGTFRGAIQDVFAANASRFPDRVAVVETGPPERKFTYGHLDAASNVLANHLVSRGIHVDDVVMIYAHRGVDLVVAVMGTLKAGATFSVIDPAYPPARQNVYLGVARPQALVVLAKAGNLHQEVTEFVERELDLKTLVQGLEIVDRNDTGSGSGAILKPLNDPITNPRVIVGPDNHPTLSFTSGSEGVPKGVRGRHFSLTYYFPWMAERFGLSENDRFTMLSGIAHDPIQRDMFTPLFLGAQLLVPTAEDIGTPGQLAEWFATYGATVTHLTPAMGQLMTTQAVARIEPLRNAFFVGDVLTKRDCGRLQSLAPNVAIINMYGTTETQRAVSFHRVPSVSEEPQYLATQKDTIPAGKGMLNVQMLVVNRHDRTKLCGVGEVGEIYVRAAGLSDGYLGKPELTSTKFVSNWFNCKSSTDYKGPGLWLGPRDRLYRTGDLGRYLTDGNAEVSGRADDQVKIRGFRIELGDINTQLARHEAVHDSVVLVRRDKDEEPLLVAYVVPKVSEKALNNTSQEDLVDRMVHYSSLTRNIRDFLKTRLPTYALPSLIVPMARLPLNPNGKIDKPRLPFPDSAELELAARRSAAFSGSSSVKWTPMEIAVRDLWLSVLPTRPPSLEPQDSFFDVGGHSILATRLVFEARRRFGLSDLPLSAVFSEPTLQGFAALVDSAQSGGIAGTSVSETATAESKPVDYAADAASFISELPATFNAAPYPPKSATVFLTGASGFLGAFVLRDLLRRPGVHVVAHVRARDPSHGMERLRSTGRAYGTWDTSFETRLRVVTGSLEAPHLGLTDEEWKKVADETDAVIHNGALVHWVYPYSTLRGPNVEGTRTVLDLCAVGRPKTLAFVSSTSVLDSAHFMNMQGPVLESDPLDGSSTGLGTGYGQTKWAGERLVRVAGERGLRGAVVRPGYVVGDSQTGVTNTDDFLVRMLKGSQELGQFPAISNGVNMVPVDHVARVTTAAALHPPEVGVEVVHVDAHPRITFTAFLSSLGHFGYTIHEAEYVEWRVALEKYVVERGDSALFPLLHFVLDNLPQNTQAAELDDANARRVLCADAESTGGTDYSGGAGVSLELIGKYVSFLVAVGFLPSPLDPSRLPQTHANADVLANFANAGGRSK